MKKLFSTLIFIASSFLFLSFFIGNDPFIQRLEKNLMQYNAQFPQEKIYVHFDKEIYTAGEDIWFKTYLRDAVGMQLSELSTVAHVELVDDRKRIVTERNIFIEKGSGFGDFTLEKDIIPGNYTLRAYTNFMRNFGEEFFFKKNITVIGTAKDNRPPQFPIPKIEQGIKAYFFPEGGDMVEGISSRVGFKIVDAQTKNGVAATGQIVDSNGKIISYLKAVKFGLGVLALTPLAGEQYSAEIDYDGEKYTFPLPKAKSNGYVMQINNRKPDSVVVKIETNFDAGLGNLYLVGQMRGSLFYAGKLSSESNVVKTSISKDSLPDGIAQITVFSEDGEPLCERLIFVERPENAYGINFSSNKKVFSNREKVELFVNVKNAESTEIPSDLSIAITNSNLAERQPYSENIRSWMLLNSDLKGKIEQPGFYFSNNKKSTKYVLDILMMTQGWRRFTWKQLAAEDFPKIEHLPELGFNLEGYITKKDSKKKRQSNVYLSVMDQQFKFEETRADAQGNFLFPNLHLFDTTTVILQAREPFGDEGATDKEGNLLGSKLFDIYLNTSKVKVEELAKKYNKTISKNKIKENLTQYAKIDDVNKRYDGWSIELDDIEVKGKRKLKRVDPTIMADRIVGEPKNRILVDSLLYKPLNVAQMLYSLPGVRVQGDLNQEEIFIVSRGRQAPPLFVVDNSPASLEFVQTIPPSNIHFIDVYDRVPVQYSAGGGDGAAIIIYTRSQTGVESIKKSDGIIHVIHPGYYKAREFYTPDHDDKTQDPNRPDYRTTLYWNGKIRTGEENNKTLSFFTCDQTGVYDVIVEGMTERGVPVFGKYQISVE